MEKTCDNCKQEYDGKVKQKYCCVTCQHEAAKKPKNPRITMTCMNCEKQFITMVGWKSKRKKYCSRTCKDVHQKEKYMGIGNPMFGKEISEVSRELHSKAAKRVWSNPDHKAKVRAGQEAYVATSGHWPGTDANSKNKRKQTFLSKYGVDHNWKDKAIREKCEITSIKRTGLTTYQQAQEKARKKGATTIEKRIKSILKNNSILFKQNYYIYFNDKEYKVYDFYLIQHNLLIEADGDYWHGNPEYFSSLNEVQSINKKNDEFKNELAKSEGIPLLRFWENEIKQEGFESTLQQVIQTHGKG